MEPKAFLDSIIKHIPSPVWISDDKGTLIRLNQACRELFRIKDDEVIGKYNVLQDNNVEEQGFMPMVRQVFENGKTVSFRLEYDSSRLKNLDLKERVFLILDVTISPVLDTRGRVTHAIIQHIDISEHKRTEELLRESESRYRTIFETTGTATVIIEKDMTISLTNAEFEKLSGYSREETEGKKSWTDFVVKDDLEAMKKYHSARRNAPGSAPRNYEFRFLDRQGNVKNVLLAVALIPGTRKTVASLSDVTGPRRVEEALRISEQTLQRTFDQAPLGAAIISMDHRFLRVNAELCRITGYSEQELLALDFMKITHPEDLETNLELTRDMVAGKFESYQMDKRYLRKDGQIVWVRMFVRLVKDPSGKSIYFFPMIEDITELKQAEEALRKSEESALRLANENAVMAEIGRIFSSTPNIEEVYPLFSEKVKKLLPYDRITINLIDKDGSTLIERYVEGEHVPERDMGDTLPMAGTTTKAVVENRKSLILDSQDGNEMAVKYPGLLPEMRAGYLSFLSSPLISRDQPIGALHFRSKKYRVYGDKDLKLAETIAAQIAGAIANVQLFADHKQSEEALRKSEETARRLAMENEIIASIGRITSSTLDTQKLYQGFGEEAKKIIPFDRIVINTIDTEKGTFKHAYIAGEGVPNREVGKIYPLQGSGVAEMVRTKSTFLIQTEDFDEYKDRFPMTLSTFQAGFRSIMDVPLFLKGKIVGGLLLRSRKPYAYAGKDVRVAERIAGQIAGATANAQLFEERKEMEAELLKSEERYRRLVELAPLMIMVHQQEKYVYANPTAVKALGASSADELLGKSIFEVIHPEYWDIVKERNRALERGKAAPLLEEKYIRFDKSLVDVEVTSVQTQFQDEAVILVIGRDITGQKKAEKEKAVLQEKLQQSQKMEAIGTLAGGIAHDFNNILTAIIGYAELAGFDIGENAKAKYHLQESRKAALRAKDLVRQILTFSRQGGQERKFLNIKPIIEEGLRFLRASLPATVEIRQDLEQDLRAIMADPTQVYQVLMNLCTNAAHAMEEKGGVLEVSLGNMVVDGETFATTTGIGAGSYVRLRVSDTGHGMPAEVLERIFDPYFTTKEVGKGTGLGLAVVHGIVKSFGGEIAVSSEVGKGSAFDVYFPRIEAANLPSAADKVEPLPLGGYERVLFVDDEKAIAEIFQIILERLGYQVVVRTSSIEALELFRAKPDQFDLVITDLTMPNMAGDRFAQELLQIRPDIPIILCTGFSERTTEEKAKAMGIREFVMKPPVIKDLAKAMRKALGSRERKKVEGDKISFEVAIEMNR